MIAHFLKTQKRNAKLVILDAKKTFSKQAVFEEAFREFYADVIEVHLTNEIDDFAVVRVDATTGEVTTRSGYAQRAAVANIIPAQRAGTIAAKAGLTEGDWCPIHPANFASTKVRDVYVLGDAAIAADMPKSAFSAISQAGVVAADIIADLSGKPRPEGKYRNTCWSMVAPGNSAKIGGDYAPGTKQGHAYLAPSDEFISQPNDSDDVRHQVYQESQDWYQAAVADLFGAEPQSTER